MNLVKEKKQRYRATIAGKTYTILGKKSHQHMQSVIKLVNHQWDELCLVTKDLSDSERSMLLTINAVSVQLEKQAEIENLKKEMETLKKQLQQTKTIKRSTIAPDRKEKLEQQLAIQADLLRK